LTYSEQGEVISLEQETTLGLDPKLEALLTYVLGWVTGIIFLIAEKDNEFVRFHAMQSLVTFLGLTILGFIGPFIPVLGAVISSLLWIVNLALWVLLMYQAYQGERYKLPIAGDIAENQLNQASF
jgi:uncharacterized membrane protein